MAWPAETFVLRSGGHVVHHLRGITPFLLLSDSVCWTFFVVVAAVSFPSTTSDKCLIFFFRLRFCCKFFSCRYLSLVVVFLLSLSFVHASCRLLAAFPSQNTFSYIILSGLGRIVTQWLVGCPEFVSRIRHISFWMWHLFTGLTVCSCSEYSDFLHPVCVGFFFLHTKRFDPGFRVIVLIKY